MKWLQDGCKLIDGEVDALLFHHLRNALTGILIEGIERESGHLQVSLLALHTGNALVNLHQIVTFYQLRHQAHQLVIGMHALTSTCSLVIGQIMQFLYNTLHLGMVCLFILRVGLFTPLAIRRGVGGEAADYISVLLNGLDVFSILTVSFVG